MTGYMDYVRAGEVLRAPSVEYDKKYILKCNDCEEYFDVFDSFWSHCIEHYWLEPKTEQLSPSVSNGYDRPNEAIEDYNFSTRSVDDEEENRDEHQGNFKNEDPLHSIKQETTVMESIKKESEDNEEFSLGHTDLKYSDDCEAEHSTEIIESDSECSEGQEIQNRLYVRKFFKSNQNIIAFITAYKSIPQLWDLNYPNKLRKYEERMKSLQKIAEELRSVLDLTITVRQVSAIIVHLRLKYRETLKNDLNTEPETTKKNDILPLWIFQSLDFLKPFFNCNNILVDSQQQEMSSEQIIHILGIYKRCPFLWNTNLMEHYCYNKRSEALGQMIKLIKVELGKEVNENDLKKYLQILNLNYARAKRNTKGARSKDENCTYHQHLTFLDGHVGRFECKECNKTFRGPIHLKEHMYNHDGIIPIHCPSCNHEFKTAAAFMAHVRRHMGDLAQECKLCGKKFLKPAELRIHMRSHTGDKPFFCELCGTSFRQQQALLAHKRKHENKFVLFCPTCSKGFYTKTKMRTHMATHEDVRNFVCGMCGKAFKTKKTMQNHEFTHEEGLNHECNICGKMFKNKINLAHHKRTHTYKIKV